jgi:hypothetical protein
MSSMQVIPNTLEGRVADWKLPRHVVIVNRSCSTLRFAVPNSVGDFVFKAEVNTGEAELRTAPTEHTVWLLATNTHKKVMLVRQDTSQTLTSNVPRT